MRHETFLARTRSYVKPHFWRGGSPDAGKAVNPRFIQMPHVPFIGRSPRRRPKWVDGFMRIAFTTAIALSLGIGALLGVGSLSGARAQGVYMYSIAASDGYGLDECLNGAECGQVVADAWCEAHGHGVALSFGPASRFTGAATPVSTTPDSYVVNCGD